ncbi:MAG: aminoacetone oxidase family FAD-binding enzyme [Lachnospiraceae bacterium]|nr:aminoacetone oxidase family FAD-binding enzyme [Lachnospiraceae bacterium]
MDFFADLGLGFTDHDGYVYPRSGQAASVSDVLRKEAQGLGVETVLDCHVSEVTPPGGRKVFAGDTYETRNDRGRSPSPGERSALSSQSSAGRSADGVWSGADASKSVSGKSRPVSSNRFRLETTQGVLRADAVVIAAGSKATPHSGSDGSGYTLARQLGHNIFPPLPALCGLKLMGSEWRSMAGCRVQGTVKLFVDDVQVAQDTGELQLTDYGVSGIPVFCISRHASIATHQKKAVTLSIDFYPEMEEEELLEFMERRAKRKAGEPWEDFLLGLFPKNLGLTLMRQSDMLRGGVGKLCRLIKSYPATVLAPNGFSLAQVCVGGVDTKEVAARNCASKLVPGLFFCGEVLNVDGVCGGYNLQFAWSSGKAAGCGAAEYLGMGQGDTLAPSAAYDKHENPAKLRASMSKAPGPTTRGRSGDGNLVAKGVSMIKNAPTVRAGAAAANTPKDKPAGQRPLGKTIKKKTLADLSGKRPGPGKRAGKE